MLTKNITIDRETDLVVKCGQKAMNGHLRCQHEFEVETELETRELVLYVMESCPDCIDEDKYDERYDAGYEDGENSCQNYIDDLLNQIQDLEAEIASYERTIEDLENTDD